MLGIAFDFDRMPFAIFDQHSLGKPLMQHCCGVIQRFAWNHTFRLIYVGQNFMRRLARASGQSGQSERSRGHP